MLWLNKNKFFTRYLPMLLSVVLIVAAFSTYFLLNKSTPPAEANWYSSSWTNRMPLNINHAQVSGTSTLSNFPALISLTNANLKTTGNGGFVASSSGADILFTDATGVTQIPYERESYSSSTGALTAWVKIPSLSPTADTTIYMYYGNATSGLADQQAASSVWDSNYKGVWHLSDAANSTSTDSTTNANSGTNTSLSSASGQMANAGSFNGSSSYINVADNASLNPTSAITMSAWVKTSTSGAYIIAKDPSSGPNSPGTAASSNAVGTVDWVSNSTSPNNVKVEDGTTANAAIAQSGGFCLSADTLISTQNGNVPIKDLKPGDLVYSYNQSANSIELKPISDVTHIPISRDGSRYYHIYFNGGDLRATYDHRFYVRGQWVRADSLKVGDELQDLGGAGQPITKIEVEANSTDDVWDFSVADNHTFFANGVLVHNPAGSIYDNSVYLIKGGSLGGTNEASATAWGSSLAYATYGGSSDTWGQGWSASDINASNFGVAISAYASGFTGIGSFNSTSYYLQATNFGFSIPGGATINGITAQIKKQAVICNGSVWCAEVDYISVTVNYSVKTTVPYALSTVGGGQFLIMNSSTNYTATSSVSVTDNSWHYLDATYDSATMKIYVDGNLTGTSTSFSGNLPSLAGPLHIGADYASSPGNFFSGAIDEPRLSASARSPDWIKTEYNNQSNPAAFLSLGSNQTQSQIGNTVGHEAVLSRSGSAVWRGAAWTSRKLLIINHEKVSGTTTPLTNFPVLINLTDADWATVANGGHVASSSGADIFFTAGDATTTIPYERESYTPTTGVLVAWVKVPSLSPTSDTDIYIYYGNSTPGLADQQNPTAVWDSNYKGVWHLPNGSTLSANDSTSNANNGTITGPIAVAGKIDGGASYSGVSSYNIDVGNSASTQVGSTHTLSAWFNTSDSSIHNYIIGHGNFDTDLHGFELFLNAGKIYYYIDGNSGTATLLSSATYNDGAWHKVDAVADGTTMRLYVDGSQVATASQTQNPDYSAGYHLYLGAVWSSGTGGTIGGFTGSLDEEELSNTARSAAWIATEYNNQNSPATFVYIGQKDTTTRAPATPTLKARGHVKFR